MPGCGRGNDALYLAKLGYDDVHHPEWFEPHAGLDESGKGDLFGSVVAATVIAEKPAIDAWRAAGVMTLLAETRDVETIRSLGEAAS